MLPTLSSTRRVRVADERGSGVRMRVARVRSDKGIFWHSDRVAEPDLDLPLSRTAASAAVADIGWRYLLGALAVSVPVQSLGQGSAGAAAAGAAGGRPAAGSPRPVQALEVAIDAIDIPAIQPFWKAVLGYVDEPGGDGPACAIVDPAGQLPALWVQQMDAPRPQRNRVHFDITVAHDEAEPRVRAALAAGGRLVDDSFARSYWVLADAEGNEGC